MARSLMILTYIAGGIGVAIGIYLLSMGRSEDALLVVTVAFAVVMGALSWVRHFLLWREDGKNLGLQAYSPLFQWEVGFANGAFAVAGFVTIVFGHNVTAMAAVCFAYAVYLLQAAVLHGWRYASGQSRTPVRLWGSCIGLGALCLMVLFVSYAALVDAGVGPF